MIVRGIKKYIRKYKIDLINIDLPLPMINVIKAIDKIKHIPIVINQQNVECKNIASRCYADGISIPMRIFSKIESKRLYKWEKHINSIEQVKGQTFVSEDDLKEYEKLFGKNNVKYFYSPIGTNLPQNIEKTKDAKDKVIVMPASFDYRPNSHGAVWFANEVMPAIRKKIPNVKLILVGRNPRNEVKKLACNDIIVTGSVADMNPYMRLADIYIVPIFFGGGVKTKLIEMGMYARPVVSTPQGVKGSIYQDSKDLFICKNSMEFIHKCVDILNNLENYQYIGNNMLTKTIDNYLWENIVKDYDSFLSSLLV